MYRQCIIDDFPPFMGHFPAMFDYRFGYYIYSCQSSAWRDGVAKFAQVGGGCERRSWLAEGTGLMTGWKPIIYIYIYIHIIWDIKSVYQQFDWGFSRVPGFWQCVHDKTNWYVALCSQSLLSISLKPWWRHCHSFSHDSSIVAFGSCSGLPRLRLASGSGASEEARCYWSHHPLWAGPRLPRYLWKYNIYQYLWSSFIFNSCSKCIMSELYQLNSRLLPAKLRLFWTNIDRNSQPSGAVSGETCCMPRTQDLHSCHHSKDKHALEGICKCYPLVSFIIAMENHHF